MPRESEVEAASEMLQRERAEAEERNAACSVRALDAALSPEPRERREARLPLLCPPALPALPGRPAPQPGSGVSAESHSSGASPEKPAEVRWLQRCGCRGAAAERCGRRAGVKTGGCRAEVQEVCPRVRGAGGAAGLLREVLRLGAYRSGAPMGPVRAAARPRSPAALRPRWPAAARQRCPAAHVGSAPRLPPRRRWSRRRAPSRSAGVSSAWRWPAAARGPCARARRGGRTPCAPGLAR